MNGILINILLSLWQKYKPSNLLSQYYWQLYIVCVCVGGLKYKRFTMVTMLTLLYGLADVSKNETDI